MKFLGYLIALSIVITSGCTQEEKRTRSKQNDVPSVANQDIENGSSQAEQDDYALAKIFLEQSFGPEGILAQLEKIDPDLYAEALANLENLDNAYGRELGKQVLTLVRDMVFESADIDQSKSLNKEEFTAFQIGHIVQTEETQAKIDQWKEESFPIVAGEDNEVSKDEFLAMLSLLRKDMVKHYYTLGGLNSLLQVARKDLLANFDKDKNGVLDQNERQEVRAAIKAEHKRYLAKVAAECSGEDAASKPICQLNQAISKLCLDSKGFLPETPPGLCKDIWYNNPKATEVE